MKNNWTRRDLLKTMGLLTAAGTLPTDLQFIQKTLHPHSLKPLHLSRPITCVVLGAGNRGNVYARYAQDHPDAMKIVGVAEPIPIRNERMAKQYNIPSNRRFTTWEHVFDQPKMADAVIITTPDDLHHGPAMQALEMGYHLLLEKPIAQTWKECSEILTLAKKKNAVVAVCHVLRYAPYFRKIKEVISSGALGELVSIQHMEPIQHIHMSHSYVRGNWRIEAETNPIILAKSCHDLDILRWWIGKPCQYISSFGSLKWFKESNAPEGSTARCTDGCAIESECPYSALKIYHRDRSYLHHFDLPADRETHGDFILNELKQGPYGRCVYRCDNDVPDHQVVAMEFEDEITVNFNMEAFTNYHGRRTRVMGTMGDLVGDERDLVIADFRNKKVTNWNVHEHADLSSGHGGGDHRLVRDFLNAVDKDDASLLTSNLEASMESHLMGFLAEKSRHQKQVMKVDLNQ